MASCLRHPQGVSAFRPNGIRARTGSQQKPDDFWISLVRRHEEGQIPFTGRNIRIGSAGDQKGGYIGVAVEGCPK